MKNWKTFMTGILAVAAGVWMLISNWKALDQPTLMGALTSILTGIGLMFAKDFNVTGGTTGQTPEAKSREQDLKK